MFATYFQKTSTTCLVFFFYINLERTKLYRLVRKHAGCIDTDYIYETSDNVVDERRLICHSPGDGKLLKRIEIFRIQIPTHAWEHTEYTFLNNVVNYCVDCKIFASYENEKCSTIVL